MSFVDDSPKSNRLLHRSSALFDVKLRSVVFDLSRGGCMTERFRKSFKITQNRSTSQDLTLMDACQRPVEWLLKRL